MSRVGGEVACRGPLLLWEQQMLRQEAQIERKAPLRVRRPLRKQEKPFGKGSLKTTFNVGKGGDAAVVHPHETTKRPGMAVLFGERARGGGADMSEDERGADLFGEPGEVVVIPGLGEGREREGKEGKGERVRGEGDQYIGEKED
jgi:hypothetical protein